jgi:hypothetical protein
VEVEVEVEVDGDGVVAGRDPAGGLEEAALQHVGGHAREGSSATPIRLITKIFDPELASASELAAVYHNVGNSHPVSLRSKPGSAAVTGFCVPTVPRWCAKRSGRCC